MGALEINPKKRDLNHNLNSSLFSETHVVKKPRFEPNTPQLGHDRGVFVKSTVSRVLEYPEKLTRFKRPVHAPCRCNKVKFLKGNTGFSLNNYMVAKKEAFSTLRFCGKKGKDVVDDVEVIDTDDCKAKEVFDVDGVERGKGKLSGMDRGVEEVNCQPSCSSVVSEDLVAGNLRVEGGEKGLEIVERREEVDGFDGPLHEKLKKSVEKRNEKLGFLGFMIEFCNKKLSAFQLLRYVKKPAKDVDRMLFVPLTDDEENEVTASFSNAKRRKVLVTHQESNIEITGEMLQCLRPGAWLNDEVINLYLVLLKEREQRDPQKFLKCHFFNTFFYKKLIGGRGGYDYKSVRRWTTQRKLGYCLFECDKIFIPIHKEIHWCLAVINKKDEKFQYLDSLRGRDKQVMKVLARYFVDEVKDKSGKEIDVSSWKQEFVEDLPEQQNGYDCGVFMIKYSDFYSKDVGLCFNQEHMPYFRRRTAKEILRLKAD
ncbi:ubiquitin-like-specific protease ESD4 [Apium graveolens]|uniref:ubiquitin-like-specific protease ESD4 n=1 Tax=Apium graveolens TaxID=4045 RepID=UPI003D78E0AB